MSYDFAYLNIFITKNTIFFTHDLIFHYSKIYLFKICIITASFTNLSKGNIT